MYIDEPTLIFKSTNNKSKRKQGGDGILWSFWKQMKLQSPKKEKLPKAT